MGARDWLSTSLEHATRPLDREDPPNLRRYPAPIEQDDSALRERLRHEQRQEPRFRSWEDQAADDAGKPRWGEL